MQPSDPLSSLAKQFADFSDGLRRSLEPVAGAVTDALARWRPVLVELAESFRRLPAEVKAVVSVLAERGWYISAEMDMPFLRALQAAAESRDFAALDRLMESWVSSSVSEIAGRAAARFPNRASLVASAVQAHLRHEFALSVPVLLIQVEGMCVQTFDSRLYSTKRGIPNTRTLAESIVDGPIAEAYLQPLCIPSGLTAGSNHRADYPDSMNRHEILHGISTDYATPINSLKAISLMDYFVTLVARERPESAA